MSMITWIFESALTVTFVAAMIGLIGIFWYGMYSLIRTSVRRRRHPEWYVAHGHTAFTGTTSVMDESTPLMTGSTGVIIGQPRS